MSKDLTRKSKFLSLVLRHDPGSIGLHLDAEGWAGIDDLVSRAPMPLTHADVEQIVATSDKQRFALSADGTRIRANQGHSIPVDLGLDARDPPDRLYHGTADRFLAAILSEGLTRQSRQHVHLSSDIETARVVGQRHGTLCILLVDSLAMAKAGRVFYHSANNVWLTESVAPQFLSVLAP